MMKTIAMAAGATVWGSLIFGIALHVHFPEEALIDRLRWQVEDGSGGQWLMDAELSLIHI